MLQQKCYLVSPCMFLHFQNDLLKEQQALMYFQRSVFELDLYRQISSLV